MDNCVHLRPPTPILEYTRKAFGSGTIAPMRCIPWCLCLALLAAGQEPKYEMRTYVLGLLKKGPHSGQGTNEEIEKVQAGHMANIKRMAAAGKLLVAGPIGDDGELRGIFIFDAGTPDEVRAMAEEDPAVQQGRLILELHPWYAAAGLKVNPPK